MKDLGKLVDLYTDYLIATDSQATATGLSVILDRQISHDKFTRMLKEGVFNSNYLWKKVKKMVRAIESEDGCLIFDDTIVEKEWTDENEIVCWHYDHSKARSVKGFNIISMIYHSNGISIPVDFRVVEKLLFSMITMEKEKEEAEQQKMSL